VYVALIFLIGGISAAGCAIWVPADSTVPQTSQESQTTTTTSQAAPVSTTKTTVVRSTVY
jgi:hypothetical protein